MLAPKIALAILVCAFPLLARESVTPQEHRARREALRKALPDGVTVLFGHTEKDTGERSGFFQDSDFYYLTGWTEPGAILMLVPPKAGMRGAVPEILFLPARDPKRERYTGRKSAAADAGIRQMTGFQEVLPAEAFEARLLESLQVLPRVYALSGQIQNFRLKDLAPLRDVLPADSALAKLRMKKTAREVELIQRSTDLTIEGFRAAWKRMAPGLFEYQIASTARAAYFDSGCERDAYAPIVASGPNSTILHYSTNSRRLDAGDLVLMDIGAEYSAYATDITRTVPASGKFTARQRELYNVVLGAQKAVLAAVRPGVLIGTGPTTPNSLWKIAYDYIEAHGKDAAGKPLGKYLTHGVSHSVGLDVHDPLPPGQPLEPGMVVTVEPGIYIPEERTGIRIEDIVLVTENGAKVLSAALPKEPDEIERVMAR